MLFKSLKYLMKIYIDKLQYNMLILNYRGNLIYQIYCGG